jgi:hypothetical protein
MTEEKVSCWLAWLGYSLAGCTAFAILISTNENVQKVITATATAVYKQVSE